ncbi:MAG: diacylglycerol kinase family lipid kinase [Caldiserica bacterium]|jgi:YegS/Rv2252/BmrU family lipid kinase|nr:diacylglycerol kinase family lipid kinase [Caldisericota bacterium]MDH7563063.1 diacylglycerol kinase family lipid kinase [Caldisericota bacterium]
MRLAIVVNPIAGAGKAKKFAPLAEEKLKNAGFEVALLYSKGVGDAVELARKAALEGAEAVIACGGDGTVFEVLNGIKATNASLGILPWGRGNDVSKDLGIPQGIEEPIEVLIRGKPREIDACQSPKGLFLGVGGIGLDAQVAVNGNKWRKILRSDFVAYELGAIVTILYYPPFPLEITIDGKKFVFEQTFLVAVGNTVSYSRGMRILPHASFADGKLDLCVVTSPTRWHLLKLFPTVFKGEHLKDPGIHYFQPCNVELQCLNGSQIFYFADGEVLGTLPASFSIKPKAVKILLPGDKL